jgi:hypothetical protein
VQAISATRPANTMPKSSLCSQFLFIRQVPDNCELTGKTWCLTFVLGEC